MTKHSLICGSCWLQLLIDIDYNIDDIPGIDPREDAYADEQEFLDDLRLVDVSLPAEPFPTGLELLCELFV